MSSARSFICVFTRSPHLTLSDQNAILSGNGGDAVEFVIALQVRDNFANSTHLQTYRSRKNFKIHQNKIIAAHETKHQAFQYLCRGNLAEITIERLLVDYLKQIAPRQFYFRTRCASAPSWPQSASGNIPPSPIHPSSCNDLTHQQQGRDPAPKPGVGPLRSARRHA